jgi:hypothetical protein
MGKRLTFSAVVIILALTAFANILLSSTRNEPNLKDLAKRRVALARRGFQSAGFLLKERARDEEHQSLSVFLSFVDLEHLIDWSRRWRDSEIDLNRPRQAAFQDHINRLEKWSRPMRDLAIGGAGTGISQEHVDFLDYAILEAKTELLKMQADVKK